MAEAIHNTKEKPHRRRNGRKVSVTDQGLLISQSLPLRRICGHWHTVTYPKINRLSVLAFPPWGGTDWGHTQVLSLTLSLTHTVFLASRAHRHLSLTHTPSHVVQHSSPVAQLGSVCVHVCACARALGMCFCFCECLCVSGDWNEVVNYKERSRCQSKPSLASLAGQTCLIVVHLVAPGNSLRLCSPVHLEGGAAGTPRAPVKHDEGGPKQARPSPVYPFRQNIRECDDQNILLLMTHR